MIIEGITARNFLSHADSTVDLTEAPLWLICGANGSGKSALFDAVEFALYGEHRGGNQHTGTLVKQGERRGLVQVTVALDDVRYRVTQHLDAKTGNLGGTLDRWDTSANTWERMNVGAGVDAVWRWLRDHLPAHGLFRSAIFLRQGDAAFFLRGTATDRMKRFAELVDLSRYTALWRCAKDRSDQARGKAERVEGRLVSLGDVTDEALHAAEEEFGQADQASAVASADVVVAVATLRGAEGWQRLLSQQHTLDMQQQVCEGLLADEASIRADAGRVAAWDSAQGDVARCWRERDRAAERQVEAKAAQIVVDRLDTSLGSLASDRREVVTRKTTAEGVELPRARQRTSDACDVASRLALEVQIANARLAVVASEREVKLLSAGDSNVEKWQKLSGVVPLLDAVVARDRECSTSATVVEEMAANATAAEDAVSAALVAARHAGDKYEKTRLVANVAGDMASRLREEIAGLTGQIQGYKHLDGGEKKCPVCLQQIDESAHIRVRQSLANKVTTLTTRQADLSVAEDHADRTRQASTADETAKRHADELVHSTAEVVFGARHRVQTAQDAFSRCESACAAARQAVADHYPQYVAHLDHIVTSWVVQETARIEHGTRMARKLSVVIATARETLAGAAGTLKALRAQRGDGSDALGDRVDANDLQKRLDRAISARDTCNAEVQVLEQEIGEIDCRLTSLERESNRIIGERATAETTRTTAREDAARARAAADSIVTSLGDKWPEALASREGCASVADDIDKRRERAALAPQVDQARGRLELIVGQLTDIARAMADVPDDHRIPVEAAAERERTARTVAQNAVIAMERYATVVANLHTARQQAGECRAEIDAASDERDIYAELADILRENGPLQVEVANKEQQRIAAEVNSVLEQLGDPLRIGIGQTQRASRSGVQDLHIMDTADPMGQARYFPYLSGGEQFRVATALALALHRRVGRGAGTIIIDEGFGALDSDRRDAFAFQLTDTSIGILRLGLAKSIVICSHVTDVQRHFPDLWTVTKESGSAAVCHQHRLSPGEEVA